MRFQLWDEVVTVITSNIRREPAGEIIGQHKPGSRLVVIGGPVDKGNLTWWQVRNGISGWVAEDAPSRAVLLDKWDDTAFGRAMRFVLSQEGGFVDDPSDKGGATLWGIAQRFNPQVNVATMTLEQAKKIYRDKYWTPAECDVAPWPLALTLFDMAVNAGVAQALNLLSAVGPDFAAYNGARRSFYQSLKQFPIFGAGWINRVDAIEKFAKEGSA